MRKIGYARVSTQEQNLARQIATLEQHGCVTIYHDRQSGKDFNRENFQKMKKELIAGDELYIKELDRLGRNKDQIKQELDWFKQNNIVVRILDIPTTLIDFKGQTWVSEMVTNILVEVLGSFAEQERLKIRERQAEGIAQAKARGVTFGPKPTQIPQEVIDKVDAGELSIRQACKNLNIARQTWYNNVK